MGTTGILAAVLGAIIALFGGFLGLQRWRARGRERSLALGQAAERTRRTEAEGEAALQKAVAQGDAELARDRVPLPGSVDGFDDWMRGDDGDPE